MKRLRLLFLIIFVFTINFTLSAQQWLPLGQGVNNMVNALAYDSAKNILYACGQFTAAEGKPVKYIAGWDGTSWSGLGSGMDNPIRTLSIIKDTLYAGGEFTVAGGTNAKCIAKWDGNSWIAIGEGMYKSGQHTNSPNVNAIIEYKGELYAGGSFDYADNKVAYFIAKWSGTTWESVGGGLNGTSWVYAMAVYKDELYVAGGFSVADGKAVNKIARWDGTNWQTVGGGLTGSSGPTGVYALAVYNNELYATGGFTSADGKPANYIAKWNGTNWQAVGSGLDKPGLTLTVFKNELYVGGLFNAAGDIPADYIAKWNGTQWSTIEKTTSGRINTLLGVQSRNAIFAGGLFADAGGTSVSNIAEFTFTSGIGEENKPDDLSFKTYPNPFTTSCTISFGENFDNTFFKNASLLLHNVLGKEVMRVNINGQQEITLNRNNLPSGIYLASIIVNGQNEKLLTKKLVIK